MGEIKVKNKSLISNEALLFLTIVSTILPEFFFYSNDIILLFLFLLSFFLKGFLNRVFLIAFFVVLFFCSLKYIIDPNFLLIKQFFSDLRPFFILQLLSYNVIRIGFWTMSKKSNYLFFLLILFSIPNLIGYFDPELYRVILKNYWLYVIGGTENSFNTNVAQIASLGGRFSSIFSQPAASGLFFFITTLVTFRLKILDFKLSKTYFNTTFFLLILSISNGIIAGSSFFEFGFLLFIMIYVLSKFKTLLLPFIFSLTVIFILLFQVYSDEILTFFDFVVSGRYSADGNIIPLLIRTEWVNIFFGFFNLNSSDKIGGDSSIWAKFLQGGLPYIIFYYLYLFSFIKILFRQSAFFNSIIITMFFSEIGFTAFSQPKASILIFFILLMYFGKGIKDPISIY
jgi:hypothetical protein